MRNTAPERAEQEAETKQVGRIERQMQPFLRALELVHVSEEPEGFVFGYIQHENLNQLDDVFEDVNPLDNHHPDEQ